MTFQEYRQHDATALAELIRKGDIRAIELVEIAIQRAEAVNPQVNAIVTPLYDMAKEMAQKADKNTPFAGVPFLVKDLAIPIAGTKMSDGSKAYRNRVSTEDSYLAQKLRQAGLSFLAKSNTPEFGLTPFTEPEAFGPTRNPWNTGRSAGGSSGGSAAGVAAGITPLATASDGGGSIRIPAANCGLFGLMPSRGRVSLGPDTGEGWAGAIRENCVARSVRDSAILLDAIRGMCPGDPYTAPEPARPYAQEVDADPGKLRIGFTVQHTFGHAVDEECVKAVHHTAKLLAGAGHEVEELPQTPFRREDLTELFLVMVVGDAAATLRELEHFLGRKLRPSDIEASNYALSLLGQAFTAEDYSYQVRRWNELCRRMAAYHQTYDILLTPVTAMPPFPIGDLQRKGFEAQLIKFVNTFKLRKLAKMNAEQLGESIFSYMPFTPIANMTGQPSMSLPLYWTPDNLPVGSMFTAAYGREDLLYRLAGQLEQVQPWFNKVPM